MIVARSSDGGATFTQFRVVDSRSDAGSLLGIDKFHLASGYEPNLGGEAVYIAYTQNSTEAGGTDQRIRELEKTVTHLTDMMEKKQQENEMQKLLDEADRLSSEQEEQKIDS